MAFEAYFNRRDLRVEFYQHPDAIGVREYRIDYDCGEKVVSHFIPFTAGVEEAVEGYTSPLLLFTDDLTFAENEGANPTTHANRNIGIRILTRDANGAWSENEEQILSGSAENPAPILNVAPRLSGEFEKALIQIVPPDATDIVGYLVHIGNAEDFVPTGTKSGTGTCIHSGADTNISHPLPNSDPHWFKVGAVDSFGTDVVNYITIGPVSKTGFDLGEITAEVDAKIEAAEAELQAQIDAANAARISAVDGLNGQLTVINGKITLTNPDAGSIGSRFLATESQSNSHATRITGMETIVGTSDSLGLRARLIAAESTITDLETEKASTTSVSNLASEITNARNGKANLAAELGTMRQTVTDGLAGKAAASDLTNLATRVTSTETTNTAQNTRLNTVESDVAGKASAAEVSGLKTEVQNARNGKANLAAELTAMRTATSDGLAGKAAASDLSALTTRVSNTETTNTAQNSRLNTVESDVAGKASAASVTTLQTEITNARGGTASLSAKFTAVNQTIVDGLAGKASTSSVSSLSSTVDGFDARITTAHNTAVSADGKASAKASFVLAAGNSIAGWSMGATDGGSYIDFHTNNFRISNGTTASAPFEIVGGVVRIKQAAMGTVSAGNITVGTLTQNMTVGSGGKIQIDGANNRILISD